MLAHSTCSRSISTVNFFLKKIPITCRYCSFDDPTWKSAIDTLVQRNMRFHTLAAPTLLAMMLVWPRRRHLGPSRLPHELWNMISREFILTIS